MHHRINSAVRVGLLWNTEHSTWEIDPDTIRGQLRTCDELTESDGGCPCIEAGQEIEHDAEWSRAIAADLPTADDLASMLGVHLTAPLPVRRFVGMDARPPSAALVDMLHAKIEDATLGHLGSQQINKIVQHLLPVVVSVDQNAHLRGAAEARGQRVS